MAYTAIDRVYSIFIDVMTGVSSGSGSATFYNTDNHTSYIELTVTNGNQLFDMTEYSYVLVVNKPNKQTYRNEYTTTDSTKLVIEMDSQMLAGNGNNKGQLYIMKTVNSVSKVLTMVEFNYIVKEGNYKELAPESTNHDALYIKLRSDVDNILQMIENGELGSGSGSGGTGLTTEQANNIAKIPDIQSTVDALPNNYASKNHTHSEYAPKSHRHDASEIDNLPSGSGTGLTTEQVQQLATAYEHSQQQHVSFDDLNNIDAVSVNGYSFSKLMTLEEYNNLAVKDSNTIYLVIDDGTETPTKTLSSISAVYNQGSTAVYPSTNLDSLKNNLTVTATYSDNSNSVISSGYSLSGNLTVGTSTITVTYLGKTTTFNVTVSEEITPTKTLTSISAVYTQGDTIVYPSTALNNLKSNLVVTAHYDDNSTETVTNYTLNGTLSVGDSTITVTYSGKTTTFNVTVTAETSTEMDSAYSYLKVTVPANATTEQSTLYLSKPIGGTMSSLYINNVSKDVPSGTNQTTTGYSLNEGENIIKIKGAFTCWNSKCNIDAIQLQNDLATCAGMFFGCPNITFNATIPSTVTSTNSMFRGSGLVNGVDIPSSVTNTSSMYQSVGTLKTPSIVPDTVTLCNTMYGGCISLQGTVNVPNSATDISNFLNSAGTNGEGISVTGINTSSVTNYNLAFYGAKITTIEQSFADLIKQAKPATVTKSICFRANDTNLSSPITIAEVHSDWKQ